MRFLKELILLTGPEGSGKTTLANNLRKVLGMGRVKVVRLRGTHTVAYFFMRLLRDVAGMHGNDLHFYRVRIPPRLRPIWYWLEMVSVLPLIIAFYYIARLKYVVVSERSVIDVIVWILSGIGGGAKEGLRSLPIRFLLALSSRFRRITFYVVADETVLLRRRPEEGFLIEAMFPYYNAIARSLGLTMIDTGKVNREDALMEILTRLRPARKSSEGQRSRPLPPSPKSYTS